MGKGVVSDRIGQDRIRQDRKGLKDDGLGLRARACKIEYSLMDIQRKDSIHTFKLPPPFQQLSPANYPSSRPKPSFQSSHPRDIFDISDKKQYSRMHNQFKNTATLFYNNEVKSILQDEVRKIKEKEKVRVLIEELKTPGNKENNRTQHHERVYTVAEQVKQKELQSSVDRLQKYLAKKEKVEVRVRTFMKDKNQNQKSDNKSLLSSRGESIELRDSVVETVKRQQTHITNMTERFPDKTKTTERSSRQIQDHKRRERVDSLRRKEEQEKVSIFMNKMKSMEFKMAKKSMETFKSVKEKKRIPIKCLSSIRNLRYQFKRLGVEKNYEQNLKDKDSKIQTLHRNTENLFFSRSILGQERSKAISERRKQLSSDDLGKKMTSTFSRTNASHIDLRKIKRDKILFLKRQFQIKKEEERERNQKLMRRLADKMSDLRHVDPKGLLSDPEILNLNHLLKDISLDVIPDTQIFHSPKFTVASKYVEQQEAKTKKKNNKKPI